MSKTMQVYYSAVLGALGGLLGWWIMGGIPTGAWNVWLAYPLVFESREGVMAAAFAPAATPEEVRSELLRLELHPCEPRLLGRQLELPEGTVV